ncbi:MAG: MXAN_5187 C-terminal domain-containing protein [Deltaproteobacteria bacterium]
MAIPKKNPLGGGATDRARARAEGKTLKPPEVAALIDRLEARLARLRNTQEQYFIGIERQAPIKEREAVRQEIDGAKVYVGRNTSLKFRLAALWNKYLSYERMWMRTEKEIEEGRYHRDVYKARLHAQKRQEPPPDSTEPELRPLPDDDFEVTEAAAEPPRRAPAPPPPPPPAAARPSPSGPSSSGLSDDRLRAVYDAYVSARKQCKEPTAGISFEQIAAKLRAQVPEIIEKTRAKAVDFKVVIKDGKATLKAVAKE